MDSNDVMLIAHQKRPIKPPRNNRNGLVRLLAYVKVVVVDGGPGSPMTYWS